MRTDLLPLKRVAAQLGISRSSLWRASRSGIANFPAPTIIRKRVFWRPEDLEALRLAIDVYPGRKAFEEQRRYAGARVAAAAARGRRPKRLVAPAQMQPDLFGGPVSPAPPGAKPSSTGRGRANG